MFPDPFNVDTWNVAALSPYTRNYTIGVGKFPNQDGQPKVGAWAQDDWRISDRLTLNLGVRYDLSLNAWANEIGVGAALFGRAARTTRTTFNRGWDLPIIERPDDGPRRTGPISQTR